MAHFAEIDNTNIVKQVVVVSDDQEHRGEEFLSKDLGLGGRWIKTSYNTVGGIHREGGTPLRKNYAGIGMIYDPIRDAFYAEQPFPSWTLNENSCLWEPPVPKPEYTGGPLWYWDEETLSWKKPEEN